MGSKTLAGLLTQIAVKTAIGVVSETIEEIVIDGLVETFFQSLVTSMGGSADLGHWVSTLMTTARETKFFHSFFSTGGQNTQIGSISQELAVIDNTISDMNQNPELSNIQIREQYASLNSELGNINQEATLSFKKLLKAGLLVGLSLIMPSMAGFNLYALSKAIGGTINQAFTSSAIKPQIQALAMKNRMVSGQAIVNQYMDIGSLFYEIPVIDSIIETASPTVETVPRIQPMLATASNFMSIFGFENGRPITPNDILMEALSEAIIPVIAEARKNIRKLKEMVSLVNDEILTQHGYDPYSINRLDKSLVDIESKLTGGTVFEDAYKVSEWLTPIYVRLANILSEEKVKLHSQDTRSNRIDELLLTVTYQMALDKGIKPGEGIYLRANWNKLSPSKYYPIFLAFRDQLAKILYKHGMILNLDIRALNSVVSPFSGRDEKIADKDYDFNTIFNLGINTLNGWKAHLINQIDLSYSPKKIELKNEIQVLFQTISSISGYTGHHVLYQPMIDMLYQTADILRRTSDINGFTIADIQNFVGSGYSTNNLVENLRHNEHYEPVPETYLNLLYGILNKMRSSSRFMYGDYIIDKFDGYLKKVRDYYATVDFLSLYPNSFRKDFLGKIVNTHPALLKLCEAKITKWSEFLGIDTRTYLYGTNIDTPPYLGVLLGMLYTVSQWKVNIFTDKDIDMDSTTLSFIKKNVANIIKDFIIDCPYGMDTYLSKNLRKGFSSKSQLKAHYEIVAIINTIESYIKGKPSKAPTQRNSFQMILSLKTSGIHGCKFTSNDFKRIFERTNNILHSQGFNYDSIQDLRDKLKTENNPLTILCIELLLKSKSYMNLHNIHIKSLGRMNMRKKAIFESAYCKSLNIILGLGRSLGFDMLFFEPLNDNIFKDGRWARHEPFSATAQTLYSFAQVLTSNRRHASWNILSKPQARSIIKAFEFLVAQDGTIDKAFIDKTFNNKESQWFYNEVVLNRWYSNPKFNEFLAEFNTRKQEIRSMSLLEFLAQDGTGGKPMRYPIAKSFYDNLWRPQIDRLYSLLTRRFLPIHRLTVEGIFRSHTFDIDFDEIFSYILIDRLDSA